MKFTLGVGQHSEVAKHHPGTHDQKDHGNWADVRYASDPADAYNPTYNRLNRGLLSVKGAGLASLINFSSNPDRRTQNDQLLAIEDALTNFSKPAPALFRGAAKLTRHKVGDVFEMPMRGFSVDKGVAGDFAIDTEDGHENRIPTLYVLKAGALALQIADVLESDIDKGEKEWVTGGQFKVLQVNKRANLGGLYKPEVVYIEQIQSYKGRSLPKPDTVYKHHPGTHDQLDHGNWSDHRYQSDPALAFSLPHNRLVRALAQVKHATGMRDLIAEAESDEGYDSDQLLLAIEDAVTNFAKPAPELFRGGAKPNPFKQDQIHKVGMTFDMPLRGFSSDKAVATDFAIDQESGSTPRIPVLYVLKPGALAMEIADITNIEIDNGEKEWLTGGTMKVVDVWKAPDKGDWLGQPEKEWGGAARPEVVFIEQVQPYKGRSLPNVTGVNSPDKVYKGKSGLRFRLGLGSVTKHRPGGKEHNQLDHGNWAHPSTTGPHDYPASPSWDPSTPLFHETNSPAVRVSQGFPLPYVPHTSLLGRGIYAHIGKPPIVPNFGTGVVELRIRPRNLLVIPETTPIDSFLRRLWKDSGREWPFKSHDEQRHKTPLAQKVEATTKEFGFDALEMSVGSGKRTMVIFDPSIITEIEPFDRVSTYDGVMERVTSNLAKHGGGSHDEKDHGNWARDPQASANSFDPASTRGIGTWNTATPLYHETNHPQFWADNGFPPSYRPEEGLYGDGVYLNIAKRDGDSSNWGKGLVEARAHPRGKTLYMNLSEADEVYDVLYNLYERSIGWVDPPFDPKVSSPSPGYEFAVAYRKRTGRSGLNGIAEHLGIDSFAIINPRGERFFLALDPSIVTDVKVLAKNPKGEKRLVLKHGNNTHDELSHGNWAALHPNAARPGYVHGDAARALAKKRKLVIPPAWVDVVVATDPKAACQVIGTDAKGRDQRIYSAKHSKAQAAAKFARVRSFAKVLPKLDAALSSDYTDPDAGAVILMRKMGLRPGSDKDTGAEKKAYGATNLLAGHVKLLSKSVRLTFIGKKGVKISVVSTDPLVRKAVEHHLAGKDKSDRLFDTTPEQASRYLNSVTPGYKLKDLRTAFANALAKRLVKGKPPTSMTEFKKRRREVAVKVSALLGNTPAVTLGSYINPVVFGPWERAVAA